MQHLYNHYNKELEEEKDCEEFVISGDEVVVDTLNFRSEETGENVVISPLTVHMLLSMLYLGSGMTILPF